MTIACIHLDRARPFTEEDLQNYTEQYKLQAFSHGLTHAACFNHRSKQIPSDIADIFQFMGAGYRMGKCSITRVTSAWVKKKYPTALYELIATIKSNADSNEVHVLIFYFP